MEILAGIHTLVPRQHPFFNYDWDSPLKQPEEVTALRRVYARGLFLVAAYAPRDHRADRLARLIAGSHHRFPPEHEDRHHADDLIRRDEKEREKAFGQNVRLTFPMADVFVNGGDDVHVTKASIDRFVELIFGYQVETPTYEEVGMYHPSAAALRSIEYGRQVGAAITTPTGDLVVVGTNEVPKAGGGPYWPQGPGDDDHREFKNSEDSSDKLKQNSLAEILDVLRRNHFLSDKATHQPFDELVAECVA